MSTVKQVEKALEAFENENAGNADLQQLRDFYRTMKNEGYVKEPRYELPLVDTIGRFAERERK
jgi:hypothetical protein